MSITIAQITDAVKTTLAADTGLNRAMSYNQLTEGMNDLPALQVYPESVGQDPTGNADRTTFQAGRRQSSIIIHADLYARQRSHLGEDMAALVNRWDAAITILEAQNTKPYFGLDGLQAFAWTSQRVVFQYGDGGLPYVGVRFILTFRVF